MNLSNDYMILDFNIECRKINTIYGEIFTRLKGSRVDHMSHLILLDNKIMNLSPYMFSKEEEPE